MFILFKIPDAEGNDTHNPQHFLLFTPGGYLNHSGDVPSNTFCQIAHFSVVNKPART